MTTLLIADDEPGIRSLVKMTLRKESYRILEAAGGNEALAMTKAYAPDLVLLNVSMPGLTGLEVCRAIRQDANLGKVKVVMLTAKAQEADIAEGIKAGADEYITKPFSPLKLIQRVDEILGAD